MQDLANFAKGWSDSLSAITIGLVALILPAITSFDSDGGLVTFNFAEIETAFQTFYGQQQDGAGLFISVIILALAFGVGNFFTHFGELLAIFPDYSRHKKIKARADAVSASPALLRLYENAYTSFRLLCGVGGMIALYSLFIFWTAVLEFNGKLIVAGIFGFTAGAAICCWFARYSFSYLDWIIFGELTE